MLVAAIVKQYQAAFGQKSRTKKEIQKHIFKKMRSIDIDKIKARFLSTTKLLTVDEACD